MLTISNDGNSVSGVTFESLSTNAIVTIDGTSMTDYADFYDCEFIGNGNNTNVFSVTNGGLARLHDCVLEADNAGDRILQTDTDSGTDIKLYGGRILGDVLHQGGDIEVNYVTANTGISCTGSSNITITDSLIRNSVDHCVELGTTGDIYFWQSTFISPGYVNPDHFYCVNVTVNPTTAEWIASTFRHDGVDPNYTVYSSVSFTFSGHRNDFEEGYNSNCTDNGIAAKGTPVSADLVVIEDSADSYKNKKVQLSNLLSNDENAIHDDTAGEIDAVAEKETPVNADIVLIEDSADSYNKKKVEVGNLPGGGGGASALSELTIDTNKDWLGYDITNLGSLEVDEALTVPRDQAGTTAGDIRYNSSDVALEYYDGSGWHDAGSPLLVSATDATVAEGDNSLTGLRDKFIVKTLVVETTSTDWTITVYSKDDYSSDPVIILKNRNGDLAYHWDYPYEDKDASSEFHYNFTDNSGTATHDIELFGTSLR
jgi:hypothetical protein